MAENPNVAQHRRGHDLFRAGDMEALAGLMTEDTVWHWPGRNRIAGEERGRDAVMSRFAKVDELTDDVELVDVDFMGSGDRTVAVSKVRATRGDEELSYRFCEVCRWEDGKLAEEWLYVFDVHAYDAFWG